MGRGAGADTALQTDNMDPHRRCLSKEHDPAPTYVLGVESGGLSCVRSSVTVLGRGPGQVGGQER